MAKILIIEDQKLLCQLYGSVLSKLKHRVTLAYNGEDGIAKALSDPPDLVILDLMLPGMSGQEVAQRLQESGMLAHAPLIVATAVPDDPETTKRSLHATAVMAKPFHMKTMVAEVRAALQIHRVPG